VLGEGVVALLYLVPIAWSTTRWGQLAGMSAAVAAFLTFNFFFIPPFYTFQIGRVEGWLILIIFLGVAAVIVGRIQYGLKRAQQREREALFMYELSTSLAGTRTPEAVARTLARQLQQMLQADLVQVVVEPDQSSNSILIKFYRCWLRTGWWARFACGADARPCQLLMGFCCKTLPNRVRWRSNGSKRYQWRLPLEMARTIDHTGAGRATMIAEI
jgi:hypothetical protein